jgi:hypothetical protein
MLREINGILGFFGSKRELVRVFSPGEAHHYGLPSHNLLREQTPLESLIGFGLRQPKDVGVNLTAIAGRKNLVSSF